MAANDALITHPLTTPEADSLAKLAQIAQRLTSWEAILRANQLGHFQSSIRGRGMEYEESRYYQPGDDIRYLDSKATARRAEAFTKIFREEQERPVFIFVDDRVCMHFATRGVFKRIIAAQLAAIFAWRSFYNGERIRCLRFDEHDQDYLAGSRSRRDILRWISMLCEPARLDSSHLEEAQTTLERAMQSVKQHARTRSLIILISDFYGLQKSSADSLRSLRRRCDFLCCRIRDPLEQAFPQSAGEYRLISDQGGVTFYGEHRSQAKKYQQMLNEQDERYQAFAEDLLAGCLEFTTEGDLAEELQAHGAFGGKA